jgi:uncharacterized membrane protein YhaH (DUF805 family)
MATDRTFHFMFRTDRGRIGRGLWWRGTLPLLAIGIVATFGWLQLRPFTNHDLTTTPFIAPATIAAFAYLIIYTFGLILIAVCHYNLSAKRFRDRGRPAAFAAALPASLFLCGALIWFIPRSFDVVPAWAAPVSLAVVGLVALWTVVDLGVLSGRVS